MIDKKEDLTGTYIKNDNGELRELYIAVCEKFLVDGTPKDLMMSNDEWLGPNMDCKVIGVYEGGMFISSTYCSDGKELTISDLKPIPTETPEEKEALDAIGCLEPKHGEWWMCDRNGVNTVFLNDEGEWRGDANDSYSYCNVKPLYRMEKASEEVEQVEWNGEGLPPVGVECEFRFKTNIDAPEDDDFTSWFYGSVDYYGAVKVLITSSHEAEGCFWTELVEFRKPETPEAKKEREELEAAYDLYIDSKQSMEPCMSKQVFISTEGGEQDFWLCIVRKTGYRVEK